MLKPTAGNVIVEASKEEEQTKSGILLSAKVNQRKGDQGIVLAIGAGVTETKKGDTVYFAQYASTELSHEGVTVLVVKETDLFATVAKK